MGFLPDHDNNDGAFELQKAVFKALNEDAAIIALIGAGKVCDFVRDGTALPYIVVGDQESEDDNSYTDGGCQVKMKIHTWTDTLTQATVRAIMKEIHRVIANIATQGTIPPGGPSNVAGFRLQFLRWENSMVLKESDGRTRHGIQRFQAFMKV